MKTVRTLFAFAFLTAFLLAIFIPQAAVAAQQPALGVDTPPTLYYPENNSKTLDTTPLFSWDYATGATKYTVELLRRSDNAVIFKNTYLASTRCAGVCQIPSPFPLPVGEYKWHVVGYEGTHKGAWSNYFNVTIGANTLSAPSLRSPGIDADVYGGRPTFKWYPVGGAVNYYVQVIDQWATEVGTYTANVTCGTYCEFRLPPDLGNMYGPYEWRVQALGSGTDMSGWSTQRTFYYTQLARPAQYTPVDGSTTSDQSPLFEWEDVTGATFYLLQIRTMTDTMVVEKLWTQADSCGLWCSRDLESMLQPGTYQWHVRAKNGRNFSQWTAYRTFTVTGSTDDYETFSAEPAHWEDPLNCWVPTTGYFTSTGCGYTNWDTPVVNGVLIFNARLQNAESYDGMEIIWRADINSSGAIQDHYLFSLSNIASGAEIVGGRYVNGIFTQMASTVELGLDLTQWHTFNLTVQGDGYYLVIDGTPVLNFHHYNIKRLDGYFAINEYDTYTPSVWIEIDDARVKVQ